MNQFELFDQHAPAISADEVEQFKHALAIRNDWATAAQLGAIGDTQKRKLRALAEASDGQVISGQRGYRLARLATLAELDHAEAWLRSQARCMEERAVQIRLVRNARQT